MEAYIFDKTQKAVGIIDTFQSFIWTDRYRGCGDFEIYIPVSANILSVLQEEFYITVRESNRMMIVEDIEIKTDPEEGSMLIVTGRSLESILERRVIWGQTVLTGNFQTAIQKLLNDAIISPTNTNRKIPNFVFKVSTDTTITALTIDTQFFGDNLYDAILSLCEEKDLGFRVLPDESGNFVFELYRGIDRSYAQSVNPWVVFSPNFENILSSNYLESIKSLRTVALAAGEGEGSARKLVEVTDSTGGGTGLSRREMFADESSVSATTDTGTLTDEEYSSQLSAKGKESLAEAAMTKSFEGEIDASRQFVYGEDFNLGDIVQIVNEYEMESTSRVSEIVHSHGIEGETTVPTFTKVN